MAKESHGTGHPGNGGSGSDIQVRRIYDAAEPADGARVLVDRLWPRGVSKEDARLTEWCKDAAPSPDLRRWYGHDPGRFDEFAGRYREELGEPQPQVALRRLRELAADGPLTLLTATKDLPHSHVQILLEALREAG
ncbi:DUF488 domain-containing protein [Streptomyces pinistramenti]|uniref:DUF488 domain-containing protein n=1 Tax=Streptomyces pinistramenti TaxID=2884812 RepID=UPI001D06FF8E|nr:DUF488 domain-containing protein [Streptomyces pinistramenti]MCB5911100.1 DUF488 domain-containing protein [Streptomyces pinistramenti]